MKGGPVEDGEALARRIRELEADNDRLRELASAATRLAEFGRFAAEQNHELRQPLLAIKGLAQLLLESPTPTPAEVHDAARHIVEQSDRMARLISELKHLTVSRRHTGPARVDLPGVLRRALSLLDYRVRKRAEVVTDLAEDTPAAAAAGDQVEQIVINLLANALDAVANRKDALIQVRARGVVEGGRTLAELCVADNGSGISAPTRGRLFEAFFTTKGELAGTGLGLAVSREIARGFGGDLTLDDRPGTFARPAVTVFRLLLPAAS